MGSIKPTLPLLVTINMLSSLSLLAQSGPNPSFQWAIVLFFLILGLLVTLSPSRRTSEIKKSKDEGII
jgi:hypothetical protein